VQAEDASTETSSVSLLEDVEVDAVIEGLDAAYRWLDGLPDST
jgi:hypothetical protein